MTAMEPLAVPLSADAADLDRESARARYGEVFEQHHGRLVRLGYLLAGDPDRAEEAVAEAFAKVWPHWQRGRVTDERAYLTRALVNEVSSSGRRLVRAERFRRVNRASAAEARGHDQSVADRSALVAALARLPHGQRAAVVLRFYDDLTEAATAEVLGLRVGTVKSQTSRALARLRVLLQEEEER
jgi:RNA polymerase sigma-70 factor (sigma-E family)